MMESPPEWIHSVLKHGDLRTCVNLASVSKAYHEELTESCGFWKVLCLKLAEERKLYLDLKHFESTLATVESWKALYDELWGQRNQFVED